MSGWKSWAEPAQKMATIGWGGELLYMPNTTHNTHGIGRSKL